MRRICYLDMDEVLADLRGQALKYTGYDMGMFQHKSYNELKDDEKKILTKIFHHCDYSNDFWNTMPLKEGAMELYSYCCENFDEVVLLSRFRAPKEAPQRFNATQFMKLKWAHQHLSLGGDLPKVVVTDKLKSVLLQNRPDLQQILVDDLSVNIKDWEKAGGIGILHSNAFDTILKLNQLIHLQKINTGKNNVTRSLSEKENSGRE